ncbi:MAG: hypothetical protein R2778_01455 [Saprospiraceae bacterium]
MNECKSESRTCPRRRSGRQLQRRQQGPGRTARHSRSPGPGERGDEGKLAAIRYARESNVPFFGICARYANGLRGICPKCAGNDGAASTEVEPKTEHPVIDLMDAQKGRAPEKVAPCVGAYNCELKRKPGLMRLTVPSKSAKGTSPSLEFNNAYLEH